MQDLRSRLLLFKLRAIFSRLTLHLFSLIHSNYRSHLGTWEGVEVKHVLSRLPAPTQWHLPPFTRHQPHHLSAALPLDTSPQ